MAGTVSVYHRRLFGTQNTSTSTTIRSMTTIQIFPLISVALEVSLLVRDLHAVPLPLFRLLGPLDRAVLAHQPVWLPVVPPRAMRAQSVTGDRESSRLFAF